MSLFVTFEGTEGSGKTTQVRLLAEVLERRGMPVVVTREPGGTALGEALRGLLLDSATPIGAEAEAYLMTAARAGHVRRVIAPALQRDATVLCDRFYDSTFAYQGGGRGLPLELLRGLQTLAVGGVHPDLTILLDVPARVGLERRALERNGNRIDREDAAFHERVALWYRQEAHQHPVRWTVVDGTRAADDIHGIIFETVIARLAPTGAARRESGFG